MSATAKQSTFKRALTRFGSTLTLHSRTVWTGTPTLTGSGTGGTLAAGTYYYLVTVIISSAEQPSAGVPAKVTVSGTTSKVVVAWTDVTGKTFNVYRSTSPDFVTPSKIASAIDAIALQDTGLSAAAGAPTFETGNPYYYFTDSTIDCFPQGGNATPVMREEGIFIFEQRVFLLGGDNTVNFLDEVTFDGVRYRLLEPPIGYPMSDTDIYLKVVASRTYTAT